MTQPAPTREAWLQALADAGRSLEDNQDAVTAAEFATMVKVPRQTAYRWLVQLEGAGKAIRTQKRSVRRDGHTYMFQAWTLTE